jgi:hypothetical protein
LLGLPAVELAAARGDAVMLALQLHTVNNMCCTAAVRSGTAASSTHHIYVARQLH